MPHVGTVQLIKVRRDNSFVMKKNVVYGVLMQPSSLVKKAFRQAKQARQKAHAPYSHYRVGAALITNKKQIFTGCNVENASYGATICAERVAILKAVSSGNKNFSDLVVLTQAREPVSPCALCLQIMAEFCGPNTQIWVANPTGIKHVFNFSELLKEPFGPKQLRKKK